MGRSLGALVQGKRYQMTSPYGSTRRKPETLDERLERVEREIRDSFDQCRVCFYTPASDCIVAECPWRKRQDKPLTRWMG